MRVPRQTRATTRHVQSFALSPAARDLPSRPLATACWDSSNSNGIFVSYNKPIDTIARRRLRAPAGCAGRLSLGAAATSRTSCPPSSGAAEEGGRPALLLELHGGGLRRRRRDARGRGRRAGMCICAGMHG